MFGLTSKFKSILMSMGNYLIIDEVPQKSDIIIVLGGDVIKRVTHGAKLYQSGYADKVLLSGGGRYMMKQALFQGIPESSIFMEKQSRTTFENAKYSLEILQNQGFKSAIVVTSPYHTRRVRIIFTRLFKGIHLTICAAPYNPTKTDKWWKDRFSTQFVISEYEKLLWHYLFEWF